MSDRPTRCAQQQIGVTLPQFKCDSTTLGDLGNLADFGKAVGSLPAQLGNIADCVAEPVRVQIEHSIGSLRTTLETVFKAINTTIPTPLWKNLDIPQIEYELRTTALWQEFKLYLQQKLYDIIKNIPGLSFIENLVNVPIPFLSGVKVLDVFTSEGRARIRAAVTSRVDSVADSMGMPWNVTFDGELGLKVPELKVENIVSRIYSEIERLLSSALWAALNVIKTLTAPITKIWNSLGLPSLPTFAFPKFDDFFKSNWDPIKDLQVSAQEKLHKVTESMLNFDLGDYLRTTFGSILNRIAWPFPTQIRQLLKLVDQEYNLDVPEMSFARVAKSVQTLFNRLPQMILELWLELIKPFLNLIKNLLAGIDELLKYIPFTFCSFAQLVAQPLLNMGSTVGKLLPPGIPLRS